jgi:preprotein translocase subunit SecG
MLASILLVLHLIVAIIMVVIILLQQGPGANAGAAFGSGASGTVFGSRGTGSFLSRMTAVLATVFMLNSAALAWMAARDVGEPETVLERMQPIPGAQEELPLLEEIEGEEDEEEDEDDGVPRPEDDRGRGA